jgi:SAM-dependent methyltransferase
VDVDHHVDLPSADLLLCITALQYVADDIGLLRRMRGILRAGGRLLVYVPVRNRRITSLYRRIVEESPAHYDMAYGRRRIYRARDAIATLEASGFSIQRSQQAYGIFGRLYFETFELLLYGMARRAWRLLLMPLAVILSPALIFLMMLDFAFPIQRGNGLLLEAM